MIQRNLMALMLAAMCLPVLAADKTLFAANSKYNYITVVDRGNMVPLFKTIGSNRHNIIVASHKGYKKIIII